LRFVRRSGESEEPEYKVSGAISDTVNKGSDIFARCDLERTVCELNQILRGRQESALVFVAVQSDAELDIILEDLEMSREERFLQSPLFRSEIKREIRAEEGEEWRNICLPVT
jgi:hypothetical protein